MTLLLLIVLLVVVIAIAGGAPAYRRRPRRRHVIETIHDDRDVVEETVEREPRRVRRID